MAVHAITFILYGRAAKKNNTTIIDFWGPNTSMMPLCPDWPKHVAFDEGYVLSKCLVAISKFWTLACMLGYLQWVSCIIEHGNNKINDFFLICYERLLACQLWLIWLISKIKYELIIDLFVWSFLIKCLHLCVTFVLIDTQTAYSTWFVSGHHNFNLSHDALSFRIKKIAPKSSVYSWEIK